MNSRFLFLSASVGSLAAVLTFACSHSDSNAAADAGTLTDAEYVELDGGVCATFSNVGDPCFPASHIVCFAECTTGGCECRSGGTVDGGGIWECTTDLSCMPDAAPFADTGVNGDDGASAEDSASDEDATNPSDANVSDALALSDAVDASPSGDAGTDADAE